MKYIFTLGLALSALVLGAQEPRHCGTDAVMRKLYAQHPELKLKRQALDRTLSNQQNRTAATNTFVVPIVFHILHLNGPENISDEQVKDAVRILNRDYGKRNPDTTDIIPVFKNIADSAGIRFVLATKDPSGNCTNGIVHHYDADTDWDDTSPTLYSYTWDPTRYLNVYIVRSITLSNGFGAAGYTYFPGTFPDGDAWDAIVVLDNYFGSIGTSANFLSRVLTHEVGHWLGLYHVFGMTNGAGIDCSDDDFVNDTPVTPGYLNCPNAAIPAQYQLCTPGVSENFQNYMDYSYCCRMFTQGQCQRMQQTLQNSISARDNLWTNANLIATGVINPTVPCAPKADFKYSRAKTCTGTPVTFTDASWNGAPTSYSWTFQGGTPSTASSSVVAITYNTPGTYDVIYKVSNSAGNDLTYKLQVITVTSNTAQYVNSWTEGFESLSQFNADWTFTSSSGSVNWQRSSNAAYTGTFSAKLNKDGNTRKNITSMTGPAVNISNIVNPILSFRMAAAEVTPNHINTLKVYASTDCGNTWNVIYNKTGQALITSSSTNPDFIPAGPGEWRMETVSLSPIAGAAYANFKFEYTRDTIPAANNIFIDNINISTATAIRDLDAAPQAFMVFPNPSQDEVGISFGLFSKQKIKLSLTDVLGRELEILTEREFEQGEHIQSVNVTNKPAGVYFLRMDLNGAIYTRKLLIE